MYRDVQIEIKESDELYAYFDLIAHKANNLYNACLFRLRQLITGLAKEPNEITKNEQDILDEVEKTLAIYPKHHRPTAKNPHLSYLFLYHILYVNDNPDYKCDEIPSQTAQQMIKNAIQNMKAYREAHYDYSAHPEKYLGEPKLPYYKKKGDKCSFAFTNQQVVIKDNCISFPLTKKTLSIFDYIKNGWEFKEMKIVPFHNVYKVHFIFDDKTKAKKSEAIDEKKEKRIVAIDLGVNNFAAMSNNFGKECLLFKGGRVKSVNHWYNKRIAEMMSRQTKGTTNKYVSTKAYHRVALKRDNIMNDFMHKIARRVIDFCKNEKVDVIVIGQNKEWKQNANLGKKENQKFVQIPFSKFKDNVKYLCEREGIEFVYQEEAYTSKASHLDHDPIPKLGDEVPAFSGKRGPTRYLGKTNNNGYHGLFCRSLDNSVVNSDLNGSANIGRKAFPKFTCSLASFRNIIVVSNPN